MGVTVHIPTPFRSLTGNAAQVEVEASDVVHLIEYLEAKYPGIRARIVDETGEIFRHVNIYVNEVAVEELKGKATQLKDGDQVSVIPAIAGGAIPFSEEQIKRYSRHIVLPEVGGKGQRRLLNSSVCIIGAGGLGSPAALYLAAAGIGRIGIVDFDRVDLSNLQRQILHTNSRVGELKVESAVKTIAEINPDVKMEPHPVQLSSENVKEILSGYDVVLNGCDNFPTRYLLNDACFWLQKPLVDGSLFRFEGQATVFVPGKGCYRCLYPAPPPPGTVPSCAEGGILGVLCGIVGSIQGIETIKLLLNLGESLAGRLIIFDALTMEFRQVRIRRDAECPVCGDHPTITELIDYHGFCGIPAERPLS